MNARWISSTIIGAALVATGCSGSDRPDSSFTNRDAGPNTVRDGGPGFVRDAGPNTGRDGGQTGRDAGNVRDGGVPDNPSGQILIARTSPPGMQNPGLPVNGAYVTYVRAGLGDDPAGFFLQWEQNGPALFVAVDPATLTPAPAVGDEINMNVTNTEVVDAQHRVIGVDSYAVVGNGNDVTGLVQDITTANDVVASLANYESEYVSATVTMTGPSAFAGDLHRRISVTTTGEPAGMNFVLRAPEERFGELGLVDGCTANVGPIPMWRFATTAQLTALLATEIELTGCANAPQLVSARASSDTTVEVTFDRPLDPATVATDSFTIMPMITPTMIAVTNNVVVVTTPALTPLEMYTITVGNMVTDDLGAAIDPNANSATFQAPSNAPAPSVAGEVIFSEVMQNPNALPDTMGEFFEVYNTTGQTLDLNGCTISDTNNDSHIVATPVLVESMNYAALARTATVGFAPAYVYANISLGNGNDSLILTCGGTEIDRVEWDNGTTFPDPDGASMNLDAMSLDGVSNDDGTNWCASQTVFATDRGTPGAANETCAVMPPVDGGMPDSGMMPRDGGGMPRDGGVMPPNDGGMPRDGGPAPRDGGVMGRDGGPQMGGPQLVINEVDYDQPGADSAEFVEIYNAGNAAADLTNIELRHVNGSNNTEYRSTALSGAGMTLPAGGYLVIGNAGVTVPMGVPFITLANNGLQNGAPDGLALIDASNGTLLDALSYEGSITAATLTGFMGTYNLVEGTAATASDTGDGSMSRLPNGSDTNDADTDWGFVMVPTPGAAN